MASVPGSALAGGRQHGLVAVSGLIADGMIHVTVGALYIAWIGVAVLRSDATFGGGPSLAPRSSWSTFRGAI